MKRFITDSQTMEDLNILGKFRRNSIFSIFNRMVTKGGEALLHQMFLAPLTDHSSINERSAIFKFFAQQESKFPLSAPQVEDFQQYLDIPAKPSRISSIFYFGLLKLKGLIFKDDQYQHMQRYLLSAIALFSQLNSFLSRENSPGPYHKRMQEIREILSLPELRKILSLDGVQELPYLQLALADYFIKEKLQPQMTELLGFLHALDLFIGVSSVGRALDFNYGQALSAELSVLEVERLQHPTLTGAVSNDLAFVGKGRLMFLTGANMAGKSTLMKSLGVACYLAHMGFPIPAKDFRFSVMDGLFSSINVSDNLAMGFSHFYAEVKRVKDIAQSVAQGNRLIVLFDELFKGTNVQDAYEGTLAVTRAFSRYTSCIFMISTHIIEVGHALKASGEDFQFVYLPTIMEGRIPRYTYQLNDGITADRQGMLIIENEGILDLIRKTNT